MYKDLTGLRFGLLSVENLDHIETKQGARRAYKRVFWRCKCECGNDVVVRSDCLITGNTKSCGCFNVNCRAKPESNRKHKLYRVYYSMLQRCNNAKDKHYLDYGGRGITVCEMWSNGYDDFYNWSMTHGYKDGLSIDRIDNNKGYSPTNCHWVTQADQCNNTRRNKKYTYADKTLTINQWAKEKGINKNTLYHRLVTLKWSIDKALTTPIRK